MMPSLIASFTELLDGPVPWLLALAVTGLVFQYVTIAAAAYQCRADRAVSQCVSQPVVTVVRPVCGLEPYSRETLDSSFQLDWSGYEIIFCAADANDPVLDIVRELMALHPGAAASIRTGREDYANPKLANMALGWRAAKGAWIVFVDSNVELPRDYLHRMFQAQTSQTGLVSAPPAGQAPQGFWGHVECAMLNEWQGRIQYAVNSVGAGFAQGKNLMFHRSMLEDGGFEQLASEAAEDAAATKLVRSKGLRVALAGPPFAQLLGARNFRQVWSRHLRWARLRRKTFPLLYAPEIFSGPCVALLSALAAAWFAEFSLPLVALVFLMLWYAPEIVLAKLARWPLTPAAPIIYGVRDVMIMAIYFASWSGKEIVWNGHVVAGPAEHAAVKAGKENKPALQQTG